MLNHIVLYVGGIETSKRFFTQALAPLGYRVSLDKGTSVGFDDGSGSHRLDFWLRQGTLADTRSVGCVAFDAKSREAVHAFYDAALAAGGTDNGAPGFRPKYRPAYYAAYVRDPDGYTIEVVFDESNDSEKV